MDPELDWSSYSDRKRFKEPVEGGADIEAANSVGQTALFLAIQEGLFEMVVYLVEHGANVAHACHCGNTALQHETMLVRCNCGMTPLLCACHYGLDLSMHGEISFGARCDDHRKKPFWLDCPSLCSSV
jgi:hypothetical protein